MRNFKSSKLSQYGIVDPSEFKSPKDRKKYMKELKKLNSKIDVPHQSVVPIKGSNLKLSIDTKRCCLIEDSDSGISTIFPVESYTESSNSSIDPLVTVESHTESSDSSMDSLVTVESNTESSNSSIDSLVTVESNTESSDSSIDSLVTVESNTELSNVPIQKFIFKGKFVKNIKENLYLNKVSNVELFDLSSLILIRPNEDKNLPMNNFTNQYKSNVINTINTNKNIKYKSNVINTINTIGITKKTIVDDNTINTKYKSNGTGRTKNFVDDNTINTKYKSNGNGRTKNFVMIIQ